MTLRIPHNRLTFDEAESHAAADAVASGMWACGPRVQVLEQKLCRLFGRRGAAAVSSGSAALRLCLRALGVKAGESVLVPAYSCVAVPNAVLALGARPVPVDAEAQTWNIDPAVVPGGGATVIVAVNTFGVPAPIASLQARGVPVVEDASHGFAWAASGGAVPSSAQAVVLSLYATKLLGAGEGGAIVSDDATHAEAARRWRDYGDGPADGARGNDKMTDIEAAIAACQLGKLPSMVAARARLAARYGQALRELETGRGELSLPKDGSARIWYRYAVELGEGIEAGRFISALAQRGIGAARPVEPWLDDLRRFPVASRAYARLVSLPLYPTLSDLEQDEVCDAVRRALAEARRPA